jgi:hypothetical protein
MAAAQGSVLIDASFATISDPDSFFAMRERG